MSIFDSHSERKAQSREKAKKPEISPALYRQIETFLRERIPVQVGDSAWTHQQFIENAASQKTIATVLTLLRSSEESANG